MKKRKIFIIIALMMIVSFGAVGKTSASFFGSDSVDNEFLTGTVIHEIDEKFEAEMGNEKVTKEVKLKNNSTADTFMRAAIVPEWVDEKGNPWAGDTSLVKINYTNIADSYKGSSNKWIKGTEGNGSIQYYYYDSIIKEGDETSLLIDSVEYNIPDSLKDRYRGKTLVIKVKSEIVVAREDALNKAWNDLKDENIKNMLINLVS